jgi:hypothetical protein
VVVGTTDVPLRTGCLLLLHGRPFWEGGWVRGTWAVRLLLTAWMPRTCVALVLLCFSSGFALVLLGVGQFRGVLAATDDHGSSQSHAGQGDGATADDQTLVGSGLGGDGTGRHLGYYD